MIQFEKILYSVSEFSDTKLNNFKEIERKAEGQLFKFTDVCPQVSLKTQDTTFYKVGYPPIGNG